MLAVTYRKRNKIHISFFKKFLTNTKNICRPAKKKRHSTKKVYANPDLVEQRKLPEFADRIKKWADL